MVVYHFLPVCNLHKGCNLQAACNFRIDTFSYLFFKRENYAFGSKLGHGVKKASDEAFSHYIHPLYALNESFQATYSAWVSSSSS